MSNAIEHFWERVKGSKYLSPHLVHLNGFCTSRAHDICNPNTITYTFSIPHSNDWHWEASTSIEHTYVATSVRNPDAKQHSTFTKISKDIKRASTEWSSTTQRLSHAQMRSVRRNSIEKTISRGMLLHVGKGRADLGASERTERGYIISFGVYKRLRIDQSWSGCHMQS